MTLRDEVAQLIFISFHGAAPNSRSREYRKFVGQIRETKVGGLILVNWSNGRLIQKAEPYAVAAFLNRMQRLAKTPLMVSGDFERGASMRVNGTTVFPHAMAFGATGNPAYSRYEGEVTAREARALGVQWIYYPVADVNNNPDNPIINIRSFGENPEAVAAQVKAFIEGAHADKKNFALATVKHFPGHGDTAVDSHMNMPIITVDRDRLDHVELVPFKAAIDAGVDSVMTAHIAVPALSPPGIPSTLSPAILTDLLKKDLGFKGIIVTDALEMAGIVKNFSTGDAAVRALEAGADVLLMPTDPDAVVKAVTAAVQSGRLTRQRIQESVIKVLSAKERVGLDRKRFVDLEGHQRYRGFAGGQREGAGDCGPRGDAGAQWRLHDSAGGSREGLLRGHAGEPAVYRWPRFQPGGPQGCAARACSRRWIPRSPASRWTKAWAV